MNISTCINRTVLLASLGYFVDMFDFFLFNMLRVRSLSDLGLSGASLTEAGLTIANVQMVGLLLGSYLSGVAGDRFGRKSCLLVSIIVYSVGSICSGLVDNTTSYATARFITGLGLAGELGQGLALISENLGNKKRGPGILIFFIMGFAGVILAGLVSEYLSWRTAYIVGGIAGLVILLLRSLLEESSLFIKMQQMKVVKGGLRIIFTNTNRAKAFIGGTLLIAPAVFTPQILWTLSPEIAKGFGITTPIKAHIMLMIGFFMFIVFDFLAVYFSEKIESRKRATLLFLCISILMFLQIFIFTPTSALHFYISCCLMAATSGVWVVALVWITEHFGTNIRSAVSAIIPNAARALAIPMNMGFGLLNPYGSITSLAVIGSVVLVLALCGWFVLKETYGNSIDFLESASQINNR
jgi:MFS transporter, putative metabolite:H+ symporter